jgi:excisionase family DNA binding protein
VPSRREVEPADLLTIREAAELLGVSLPTLRRWDASGKFRARRHPINGYRLYARKDVVRLLARIIREAG